MATPFDELVGRLTHRLRIDPELQCEIAQELRTHLQDCAADFQGGGMKEDEAAAAAIKALGDEGEIAEKLWQANRRRIRVRKAVKWAVGVTIFPAAGAAAIAVGWGAIATWAILLANVQFFHYRSGFPGEIPAAAIATNIADHASHKLIQSLPPAEQLEFDHPSLTSPEMPQWAKTLAENHGADRNYWANYGIVAAGCFESVVHDPKVMNEDLAVLDQGAKIDPGNALYPFFKAYILMESAIDHIDNPNSDESPLTAYGFHYTNIRPPPYSNMKPK